MDFVASTWFLPVAVPLWTVLLTLCVVGYFFALRPSPGSLQWIAQFDTPPLTLSGTLRSLTVADGLWMAIAAALGATTSCAMNQTISFEAINFAQGFFLVGEYILLPMISCAAAFWLLKSITGDLPAAFWGSALVALDVISPAAPIAITAVTAALLDGYTSQPLDSPLWQRVWLLGLLGGLFAVGIYFYGGLIFLALPVVAMIFGVNYEKFLQTGHFWRQFSLHLALFVAFALVALAGIFTPVALVEGLPLVGTALQGEFYTMLFAHLEGVFTSTFHSFALFYALFSATTHWPLLIAGLSTLPPLLHSVARLHRSTALFILLFGFTITLIWLTTGTSALFFAVALGLAFSWSQLKTKESLFLLISWSFLAFIGVLLIFMMILI